MTNMSNCCFILATSCCLDRFVTSSATLFVPNITKWRHPFSSELLYIIWRFLFRKCLPFLSHTLHISSELLTVMDNRAWIIVVLITIAALRLSVLSRSPSSEAAPTYHSHRRLKLPSSFERRRIDNNHLQGDDVTSRLAELFPKVDVDPTDGFLSEHELTVWNLRQAHRDVFYRSRRVMHLHDENRDGFVSYSEYHTPSWLRNEGNGYFGFDDMGWWKDEHFNASDADGDGRLNSTEFTDFLHPADSKNPKLLQWLCKEEVRERDTDRDGKVSFKEFFHGLFDLVRSYDEESKNDSQHYEDSRDAPARALFAQLDKDGDGYLSHLELLPIIGKIHPSEHYYAKRQAIHIISEDDVDKDGRLTLAEVIRNPYLFYDSIFNNNEDEYGSDDESH